jgi:hypothetical protein
MKTSRRSRLRAAAELFDRYSDAALADRRVTAWAGRIWKLDFARLVEAFGRLRGD